MKEKLILLKNIIKQEKKLFNFEKNNNTKINGKNYPYFATKYIKIETREEYIIKIYFIPKHFSMEEQILIENGINHNNHEITNVTKKFQSFYKSCQELYNKNSTIKQSLNTKKEDFEFIDLEKELVILNNIFKELDKIKLSNKKIDIYSDMIVGEVNYDLEIFNNDKSVIAQTIYQKDQKIFKIINSYLKAKFSNNLIKLLQTNKNHQNSIFKDILKNMDLIKKKTNFEKENTFVHKSRLQSYLKESNNKEIIKKNKKLIDLLNELLLNNIEYDDKYNYKRQTIPLDKVWEEYCQEFLEYIMVKRNNQEKIKERVKTQEGVEFINLKIKNFNIKKTSKPDFIIDFNNRKIVFDAKYKLINKINDDSDNKDINKLCRDMLVHEANEGVLILVMEDNVININDKIYTSNKNYEYKEHKNKEELLKMSFYELKLF